MANVSHAKRGARIGVKNLVFAALLTDAAAGATYDTSLHEVPGTIEIGLTANVSADNLGADDNPTWDIYSALDSVDVDLTLGALPTDVESFLLGRTIDTNGVMVSKSSDVAPWVAMGYKTLRTDNSYDYIWLYKGKFKAGDDTSHTKEKGTVNFQTPKISATFGPRDYDESIMARVNSEDDGLGETTISTFLTAPYAPAA